MIMSVLKNVRLFYTYFDPGMPNFLPFISQNFVEKFIAGRNRRRNQSIFFDFSFYIFQNGNDIMEINDQSTRKLNPSKIKIILKKTVIYFFTKNKLTIILPILVLKNIFIIKSPEKCL